MGQYILVSVLSFLGGALISAMVFMFAFVSRLANVETKLSDLCESFKTLKANRNVCEEHTLLSERVAVIEAVQGQEHGKR